eukprot:scaffold60_cov31-Phaeocystis_antarctica.AAC.1
MSPWDLQSLTDTGLQNSQLAQSPSAAQNLRRASLSPPKISAFSVQNGLHSAGGLSALAASDGRPKGCAAKRSMRGFSVAFCGQLF